MELPHLTRRLVIRQRFRRAGGRGPSQLYGMAEFSHAKQRCSTMIDQRKLRHVREFAATLGERQQKGVSPVYALSPQMVEAPTGAAPPSPLQVLSMFDTRPVAAYDFVFDLVQRVSDAGPIWAQSAEVPNGYTAVLRRVELEFLAPFVGDTGPGVGTAGFFEWRLTRNGGAVPNCVVRLRGSYAEYTWHTHQVFAARELMGLRGTVTAPTISPSLLVAGDAYRITAKLFGTLILSRNNPANMEIGSLPVLTQPYDPATFTTLAR